MNAEYTDTRTLAQLAQEALDIQNACNLTGLVHGFSRSLRRLRDLEPDKGTDYYNQHPIVLLWVDKLQDLSRSTTAKVFDAYQWCEDQAKERQP